jgi:hypothetical protein
MKIVINSHKNSSIALEVLLKSLSDLKSNPEIFICIGGFFDSIPYEIEKKDNITIIKCNHNSIDWTSFIALIETNIIPDGHIFYMHDTCKVGPNFLEKLQKINLVNVSTISISNQSKNMNMGFYSIDYLKKMELFIIEQKNTSEAQIHEYKKKGFQTEDYLFLKNPNNKKLAGFPVISKPTDFYGTGILRKVYYYETIDLYKMQANWQFSDTYELGV